MRIAKTVVLALVLLAAILAATGCATHRDASAPSASTVGVDDSLRETGSRVQSARQLADKIEAAADTLLQ